MDIDKVFSYQKPTLDQVDRYTKMREAAKLYAFILKDNCPDSRELTIALNKLRECVMWANAAIALNERPCKPA